MTGRSGGDGSGAEDAGGASGARDGGGGGGGGGAGERGPARWHQRLREGLRHAFAVEPRGPAEPTPEERAALEPLIREIRRRGMTGPAVLFLESMRPLNGVGAQTMHFMAPFATAVLDPVRYQALARYLERRGSIDWLVRELS